MRRKLLAAGVVLAVACGGRMLPGGGDADASADVVDAAPRFCDGATLSQACADPACESQFLQECDYAPHIEQLYCHLTKGWPTCDLTIDGMTPCPDGYHCVLAEFQWGWDASPTTNASCIEVQRDADIQPGPNIQVSLCWPNP